MPRSEYCVSRDAQRGATSLAAGPWPTVCHLPVHGGSTPDHTLPGGSGQMFNHLARRLPDQGASLPGPTGRSNGGLQGPETEAKARRPAVQPDNRFALGKGGVRAWPETGPPRQGRRRPATLGQRCARGPTARARTHPWTAARLLPARARQALRQAQGRTMHRPPDTTPSGIFSPEQGAPARTARNHGEADFGSKEWDKKSLERSAVIR